MTDTTNEDAGERTGGPKPVLNYQAPAEERSAAAWRAAAFVGGAVAGAVVVCFAGLVWVLGLYVYGPDPTGPAPRAAMRALPPVVFGLAAAAAAAGLVAAWRADRRRWVVLGLLTGVGAAALVEGACFATSIR
jgi:hypothetical protein